MGRLGIRTGAYRFVDPVVPEGVGVEVLEKHDADHLMKGLTTPESRAIVMLSTPRGVDRKEDILMANLKKRSGRTEEFNQSKLERSLRQAGASGDVARQIAHELAAQLGIREGMSTSELRSQVLSALRTKDTEAAERYERTRSCQAKNSSEVAKDIARLHPETLKHLGVTSGTSLRLEHGGKTHSLRAEESSSVPIGEVQLHSEALQALGASPGAKLPLMRTAVESSVSSSRAA